MERRHVHCTIVCIVLGTWVSMNQPDLEGVYYGNRWHGTPESSRHIAMNYVAPLSIYIYSSRRRVMHLWRRNMQNLTADECEIRSTEDILKEYSGALGPLCIKNN